MRNVKNLIVGQNKDAFTLAEVLITLGVIGVVAAITLPSVINNYREKQFATAWKKTYSEVSNAALLMLRNGEDLSSEIAMGNAFAKYLKIDKVCEAQKAVEQGCWRKNTPIYAAKDKRKVWDDISFIGAGSVCMNLVSGSTICFDYGNKYSVLTVDVNGSAKPNIYGTDIFFAVFNKDEYQLKPAKGVKIGWGAADGTWVIPTLGDGTCTGNDYGQGCSFEKLYK